MAENGKDDAAITSGDEPRKYEEHSSEDEEEEETEPRLKYTKLTAQLSQVFKGKDSASTCLASGDRFLVGTHNGSVYAFSLPSLELLRSYKAHSASITALSVSPYAPSVSPSTLNDTLNAQVQAADRPSTPSRPPTVSSVNSTVTASPKRPRPGQSNAPRPSASIHIGSASIDGHVCVSSITDPQDVTLRNFARPIQAVALSPEYKSSRSYISGGLAGHLVFTAGGKQGTSETASTINAAAAASGWLGQIGLGSTTGQDTILHQGEGSISAIKWSLSGKFVAWVNETGIKIMRSNLGLGSEDQELAWRRIGHVDKPSSATWEDKSALWKGKVQWVDERFLERHESIDGEDNGAARLEKKTEQLLVGWGDTVWLLHVYGEGSAARSGRTKGFKSPNIVHQFKFDDGVISGLSLYTPDLLLALIYRTRDDDDRPISTAQDSTPRRGIQKRQSGMPPELRLIDITSNEIEELDIESLKFDRFQTLSFADYHMSTVFFSEKAHASKDPRSSLGVLGDGLWDVSKNATRLFSSNASVMSGSSDAQSDRRSAATSQATTAVSAAPATVSFSRGLPPAFTKPGLKVFVLSPFDSLLHVKRDGGDHLAWLKEQEKYEQAWDYVDQHPDVVAPQQLSPLPRSRPETPSRAKETLAEFLDDDSSSSSSAATTRAKSKLPAVGREKRIIGDLWVGQLVKAGNWALAGSVAGKVLDLAEKWEHWISIFAENDKFDEISYFMPTQRLKPQIPPYCYERILQHYVDVDRVRLQALLDNWNTDLFDVDRITSAIRAKLDSDDPLVHKHTSNDNVPGRDWSILENSLAHLYLAANHSSDALHCYLLTRNSDRAIELCREQQLFSSISESVYEFSTIAISQEQEASAPLAELDEHSKQPISLLASAAAQNIIPVASAVSQFQKHSPKADRYLFFYLRTLWEGDVVPSPSNLDGQPSARIRRSRFAPAVSMNTTRHLLTPYGDLAVTLFAAYSPPLLNALLRARDAVDDPTTGGSIPYTFEHASAVCENHGLMEELVYLLAATGQSQIALHRICEGTGRRRAHTEQKDDIDDNVKWAIQFCRETDDQSLWNDLLSFSMKRPRFLRGLLNEVSIGAGASDQEHQTGINPIELVRGIAEGMEIPGLKQALERLMKDADVQKSIAAGAAQILSTEIMTVMEELVTNRKIGFSFDLKASTAPSIASVTDTERKPPSTTSSTSKPDRTAPKVPTCAMCDEPYQPTDPEEPQDHLIAYPCSHVYHLNCLLDAFTNSSNRRIIDDLQRKLAVASSEGYDGPDAGWRRGRVGSKVARMQMVGRVLGGKRCLRCQRERERARDAAG